MLTLIEPMDGCCIASLEDIESCSLSSQFLNVSNVDTRCMFVFLIVSMYAMLWYMCESMEVVGACVWCGVCAIVHKYVSSLLCVLYI